MRKLLPIIGIGCAGILVLALIITGSVMLLHGLSRTTNESGADAAEQRSLAEARSGFHTRAAEVDHPRFAARPGPTLDLSGTIAQYSSPAVGLLQTYESKDPDDGRRHPAVVWVHGGYQGIDRPDWDHSRAFRDEHFVTVCPSFRGENRNPGKPEILYGEVDDLLAAVSHTARLPYVDPHRVYVVGHDEGGTLALLAAATGTELPRAVFAIDAPVNLPSDLAHIGRRRALPFALPDEPLEWHLRSPAFFAGAIRRPTFYIGPASSSETREARLMAAAARRAGAPVDVFEIAGSSLEEAISLIVRRLQADTGPVCKIHFDEAPPDDE